MGWGWCGSLSRGLCPGGLCLGGFCLGVSVWESLSGGSLFSGETPVQWQVGSTHPTRMLSCYRPQTKFAKVMVLQVSVCPHWGGMCGFIRGVCVVLFGGACMVLFGGACMVLFGGHAWFYLGGCAWFYLGGMCGFIWGGMHGFIRGACMVFPGGHVWFFQFFRIQWDTVNERAVRILLECILVFI